MDGVLALLVVDDDIIDRRAIRRALRIAERPIAITEAEDSAGALALIETQIFDCVLLDYRLPDADALSVIYEIRERGNLAPIVVLTGQGDERIAVALMKAGATDYLTKDDLSPGRLLQSILSSVRVQEAERQAAYALQEGLERLRFQNEASQILAASLDRQTVLSNLAHLIVPRLADWCAVRLLDNDGFSPHNCVYPELSAQPWSVALAAQLKPVGPPALDAPVIAGSIPLAFPTLGEAPITLAPNVSEQLSEAGITALLCVPIAGYNQIMGTLILARCQGRAVFSPTDLALAQDLAQRLAVTLHNAHLYLQSQTALKLRDEFVAIAAHELRTPLTGLLGYVQLLDQRMRRRGDLSQHDERMLRTIIEQGLRLSDQVSRLIDLSNLKRGEFSLERRPLDLGATLAHLVERRQSHLNQHTLELLPLETRCIVLGDQNRLIQAFEHLLHNAIQYSPDGGHIIIHVEPYDHWAHVIVTDTGIGIPQEALPYLFRRFYRANNADDLAISGIGLGLYIVSEIITLHGGEIDVQSQIGQGSSFTVRLPLLHEA